MFVNGYQVSRSFTKPIVLSHRDATGKCFSGVGAFVIINADGWAVTAAHIITEILKMTDLTTKYWETEKRKQEIYNDNSIDKHTRSKKLKTLPKLAGDTPTNFSAWWSDDGARISRAIIIPGIDLGFVKLDGVNLSSVSRFPIFKNPQSDMLPGKSLCRIGFPFATITPSFDADLKSFQFPQGTLPIPLFPNEGIFTRNVVVPKAPDNTLSYELLYLETSSPGLRGQSGGPIFDSDGYIWGIQSQTRHYPLGFSPDVPNGKNGEKEHQFLNIGWGVHVKTIISAMRELSISFNLSPT